MSLTANQSNGPALQGVATIGTSAAVPEVEVAQPTEPATPVLPDAPVLEVPQPTEPATPVVPDAPVTPIDPDPGTPAAPERPATVPEPDEPATPVLPEPSPGESESQGGA